MNENIIKMELVEEIITPEKAKKYLECNVSNRRLSKSTVKKYSDMMKAGEWYFSHQAIAFSDVDDKEILIDGQHRLAAIIQANVTLKFTVVHHAIQTPYIDTVKTRNFIDNLNIFNDTKKYTRTMMGVLNLLSTINKKNNLTQLERQCFCDYYYNTFLKVEEIYKHSKTKSGGCPLKVAIFIAYNNNLNVSNLEEKLNNYIYIFNTGNVSIEDGDGMFVKEMRDHYYLQNREFSKIMINNSASYKRKRITSVFLYSIESYLRCTRYNYKIDMYHRLEKKVAKQMEVIFNVTK